MKIMSMSESRSTYAATLNSVIDDQEEVVVTRPDGDNVVMIPQREWESIKETLYLMSSPVNHQRLLKAIGEVEGGQAEEHTLIEVDE